MNWFGLSPSRFGDINLFTIQPFDFHCIDPRAAFGATKLELTLPSGWEAATALDAADTNVKKPVDLHKFFLS